MKPSEKQKQKKMSVLKKATVVFIPFPMASHMAAAVKAAQLLSVREHLISITVLVMNLPFTDAPITSYIKNYPTLNFLQLPVKMPDSSPEIRSPESWALRWVECQKCLVRDAIVDLMESSKLAGIVVDLFCAAMIDLAKEVGAPSYVFFTAGAAFLGLMFRLQSLRDDECRDPSGYGEDSGAAVSVPAFVNSVPARVWPSPVFDNGNGFLDISRKFREAKGIVVNTFLEFESHAIGSLLSDEKIPTVYPVGPIVQDEREDSEEREKERHKITEWLDQQPDDSVVFLCFGTHGCFEEDQVRRIAAALESSGHGFLWSLRKPPPKGEHGVPGEFENLDEVLPEGFLDSTAGVGKVIGWAPQKAVLSHPAVGGFVSHCGWNSILESVWCGVPMAVWPLAGEQQLNAFELVKELEIAVDIKMDFRKNNDVIVGAEKIEQAIRVLMDGKNEIRVKVKELKDHSRKTIMEEGSSFNFFGSFIDDIIGGIS